MFSYTPKFGGENLPYIEVNKEEFIRLAINNGMGHNTARATAMINKSLGAYTQLGYQMVRIVAGKQENDYQ